MLYQGATRSTSRPHQITKLARQAGLTATTEQALLIPDQIQEDWALLRGSFGVFCVGGGFSATRGNALRLQVFCAQAAGALQQISLGDAGSGVYTYIYIYACNLTRWAIFRLEKVKKQRER